MEKPTALQIVKGWLNANHHDLYSKEEYKATLARIVEILEEEKREREEEDQRVLTPAHLDEKVEHLIRRLGRSAFDEYVELGLDGTQITVEVNTKDVVNIVIEELKEEL
jgi:16S rRNA C967 or C1407 C5-methylase (RsmB/RsmF family)